MSDPLAEYREAQSDKSWEWHRKRQLRELGINPEDLDNE